ncbi:MAG: hypothetical protein FGM40_09740 [Rhodocyclaceae bacterium]|nr:hypothetical protein [Rhodocyclaceae bacterium]
MSDAGLPSPRHKVARSVEEARAAAIEIGFPLVVKPADRERGEGVCIDVTPDTLQSAFEEAQRLSPGQQVLIEQQVEGVCHRLFIAFGRLLYAVKRLPIGVYADGIGTVAELVAAECARQQLLPPWQRTRIQPVDALALQTLEKDGLTPQSVPAQGRFVRLRSIESTAWGGVDEEVTHAIHPHNLAAALEAVAQMNLEVAGVDIISRDIAQPWHVNGAVINEVNYAPLLGGGDISRKYLDEYLDRLLVNNGRIPVEVYIGGAAAWAQARARWSEIRHAGQRAWLTSAAQTLDAEGEPVPLTGGLFGRVRALVLRQTVDAMVLVVENDEFLSAGLPLDRVDAVHGVDDDVRSCGPGRGVADTSRLERLVRGWALG